MSTATLNRLCGCLLNISEARNRQVVESVAASALKINTSVTRSGCIGNTSSNTNNTVSCEKLTEVNTDRPTGYQPDHGAKLPFKACVLNIFSDWDYNRSVLTIAAPVEHIGDSVFEACVRAYEAIDMTHHDGGHPRLGAVDLVPIYPLSREVSLQECGQIAKGLAERLTSAVPGVSSFLFGYADEPQHRGLAHRRKQVGWFQGSNAKKSHQSGYHADSTTDSRYGVTGIGASPYVTNCNITIDTQDLKFGRHIAHAIRGSTPGGLPGVQCMAFPHEGKIEIACNVEGFYVDPKHNNTSGIDLSKMICSFDKYYHVPGELIEEKIRTLAAENNVKTYGKAIIGFTPEEAARIAMLALENGPADFWRTRQVRMM